MAGKPRSMKVRNNKLPYLIIADNIDSLHSKQSNIGIDIDKQSRARNKNSEIDPAYMIIQYAKLIIVLCVRRMDYLIHNTDKTDYSLKNIIILF